MSTEISSNIIAIISSLKAKVVSSPTNPQAVEDFQHINQQSINLQPSFLQSNKLLRIQVLTQINKLVSELKGYRIDESDENESDKQTLLKIIILQLRIELIRLESQM